MWSSFSESRGLFLLEFIEDLVDLILDSIASVLGLHLNFLERRFLDEVKVGALENDLAIRVTLDELVLRLGFLAGVLDG